MQMGRRRCYNGGVATSSAPTVTGIRELILRVGSVIRRIIGAPDYERYVSHLRQAHPGEEPVSEKEFIKGQMDGRVKPGSRCC